MFERTDLADVGVIGALGFDWNVPKVVGGTTPDCSRLAGLLYSASIERVVEVSSPQIGLLRNKVLFGSDYPLLRPERWIADFAKLEIKDDVRPLIMKDNAASVLGLT